MSFGEVFSPVPLRGTVHILTHVLWKSIYTCSVERIFPCPVEEYLPLEGYLSLLPLFRGRAFTPVLWRNISPCSVDWYLPLLCGREFTPVMWRNIYSCLVKEYLPLFCGGIVTPVLWRNRYPCSVAGYSPLSCGEQIAAISRVFHFTQPLSSLLIIIPS